MKGKGGIVSLLIVLGTFSVIFALELPELPSFEQASGETTSQTYIMDNLLNKFGHSKEKHFSIHAWGKNSAPVDAEIAKRIKDAEIEIGTDASVLADAISFNVIPEVGPVLAKAACGCGKLEDMRIAGIADLDYMADSITNTFMNLKDVQEYEIQDEEKIALILVSYGGPAVNLHAQKYAMDTSLSLHFTNEGGKWGIVDKYLGKTYYEPEYGIVLAIPRIRKVNITTLNKNMVTGKEILMYRIIIAGNTRKGTQAAGYWYADVLNLTDEVLEDITTYVCGGSKDEIINGLFDEGLDYFIKHGNLDNYGDNAKALEAYVKTMLAAALDQDAKMRVESELPGYAALVKYDPENKYKLVRMYPLT